MRHSGLRVTVCLLFLFKDTAQVGLSALCIALAVTSTKYGLLRNWVLRLLPITPRDTIQPKAMSLKEN